MNVLNYTYQEIHRPAKVKRFLSFSSVFSFLYKNVILKIMKTLWFWVQAVFLRIFIKQLRVLYSPFKSSIATEEEQVLI